MLDTREQLQLVIANSLSDQLIHLQANTTGI